MSRFGGVTLEEASSNWFSKEDHSHNSTNTLNNNNSTNTLNNNSTTNINNTSTNTLETTTHGANDAVLGKYAYVCLLLGLLLGMFMYVCCSFTFFTECGYQMV